MSEWWRPAFQTTVDAFYHGDMTAGLRACELLNALDGLPAKTEMRVRQNLPFYTPALADLAPSTSSRRIECPVAAGWSCYNPSIAAADDGFRMIVRSGNYRVDPPLRYTYFDPDGIVRTTNYLIDLGADLAIRHVTPIDDRVFRPDPPHYLIAGYEDCRLFHHRDAWWYTATVRDRDASGVCQIGLVRLDGETAIEEHLLSDGEERHEKNWMPVIGGDGTLRFIHSCSPVTVLRYCDETGQVREEAKEAAPFVARRFRGGSQALPVNGGHLSLVHEVVWPTDGGRIYLHRWVWFDAEWRLARVSPPFTMRERGIEFVAGLAQQGDSLVISYGVWDREAWLTTIPLAEVLPLLAAPLSSAEAEARIRADAAASSSAQTVPPVPTVREPDPPEPPAETLPISADTAEWWRPEFQITVEAYARGDLAAGELACERLRSVAGLPERIEQLTRRNAVFYAPRLAQIAPSFAAQVIEFPVPATWSRFNPSVASDSHGNLRMIVRSSNYEITRHMRYTIHDENGVIRTANYLLDLSPDLHIEQIARIDDSAYRVNPSAQITGFEDCRLIPWNGSWWLSATVWDYAQTTKCPMSLLRLEGARAAEMHLLSDGIARQEKNWMPVHPQPGDPLRFVYQCFPTIIHQFDEALASVTHHVTEPAPLISRHFSGGTQVIPIAGGYLCLVHEAVWFEDNSRVYSHRWVWFDPAWRLARLSRPFTFGERGVEFAGGLARRDDDLIISYGVGDRDAWLATVAIDEVLPLLAPPLDPDLTAAEMCAHSISTAGVAIREAAILPAVASSVRLAAVSHASDEAMNGEAASPAMTGLVIVATTLAGNNHQIIGDALRSVIDWVDWCLLIDTGITDETIAVAREIAGDKLLIRTFPWRDDFAAARNFALEAASDIGADWAVTLDTDERLALNGVDIRAALAATAANALHVEKRNGHYVKERFFRLARRGNWIGPTHEAYIGQGQTLTLPGVAFSELGKSRKQYQHKVERDITILTRHTAEHPDDPRWFYYLGDSYAGMERYEEAITAFRTCASLDGWDEEGAWAMYRSAQCFLHLGRPQDAIGECAVGMEKHPGLPDLPWQAAYAAWQAGNAAHAAYWARHAIALGHFAGIAASVPRIGFRYPPASWEGPYDILRFALRQVGDDAGADEAERLYHEALAARESESTIHHVTPHLTMQSANRTRDDAGRNLAEEYLAHQHEVEGWLDETAARVTAHLLRYQVKLGLTANVLEIGVHHGRYFLVLATGLAAEESGVAIDIFDDQQFNVSRSGKGDRYTFEANLARFAPHVPVEIIQAESTALGADFVSNHAGMRFISIDGGHDRATACSDLWLSEKVIIDGGIVALDDIYRPDWSGVTAGLARYFAQGGTLTPFAFIPNKLLLTTDAQWAERYRAILRADFSSHCSLDHPRLEVFAFDDVLLILS